jgi:predicted phage-related endonuclease
LNEDPKEGVVNGNKSHEEMLARIEELKAMTGPLEDERKSLEETLKLTLGTSTRMEAGTYTVSWTPVKTSRFNSGLFKKQQPELFHQFTTESSYRKFQIRRRSQNVE